MTKTVTSAFQYTHFSGTMRLCQLAGVSCRHAFIIIPVQ
jgi:hypothetical protein